MANSCCSTSVLPFFSLFYYHFATHLKSPGPNFPRKWYLVLIHFLIPCLSFNAVGFTRLLTPSHHTFIANISHVIKVAVVSYPALLKVLTKISKYAMFVLLYLYTSLCWLVIYFLWKPNLSKRPYYLNFVSELKLISEGDWGIIEWTKEPPYRLDCISKLSFYLSAFPCFLTCCN